MLKDAIEKLQELIGAARVPNMVAHGGRTYCDKALTAMEPPHDDARQVATLTGLADLLTVSVNGASTADVFLHVLSPTKVVLCDVRCNEWGKRQIHATASLPEFGKFPFGQFIDQEQFIIGLQSFFVQGSPDLAYLYSVAGLLTAEQVQVSADNGVGQVATMRKGVVLAENKEVKRVVTLTPWRTFREIDQPSGQFIFRLKNRDGQVPILSLHVADGEMWQLKAMQDIKAWLEAHATGAKVVA